MSSTNQLQEQVEVARFLTPMAEAANMNTPQLPSTFEMDKISVVDLFNEPQRHGEPRERENKRE